MEYIRNIQGISIDIYDQKHRPNGAAAEGGRPIGAPPKAAPVFLIINIYGYSLYIPYIFHIYSIYVYIYIYIFPSYVPYVFPCVFLNLWSQE